MRQDLPVAELDRLDVAKLIDAVLAQDDIYIGQSSLVDGAMPEVMRSWIALLFA
jgi:hypothetical protein